MDLASYLLKPVQRMGKYALLLHAMKKRATGEDEKILKEAEELVKFQLRHGNDLLTMDSIQDCDVNLKEQGNLLRQEQFVIYAGRKKIVRRVFLFEELILFSKPIQNNGGHDHYQYKCSYKTAEIGMTENIGDSGFKFEIWFRKRHSGRDTFTLQSVSRSVKRAWVEEIRGLLWKQALRNKDHRRSEMTSMGVGSKPHIDLATSSENTIVNRSVDSSSFSSASMINISDRMLDSSRGDRSSVSLDGSDHHYDVNSIVISQKRPHSIISTSSSTSSRGSATGTFGAVNMSSWPCKIGGAPTTSPPYAYRDFHAIAEVEDEQSEAASESAASSSECASTPGKSSNETNNTADDDHENDTSESYESQLPVTPSDETAPANEISSSL